MELRLVIRGEPTAALGVAQTRHVLELVKRLGEQQLAVILISHNLPGGSGAGSGADGAEDGRRWRGLGVLLRRSPGLSSCNSSRAAGRRAAGQPAQHEPDRHPCESARPFAGCGRRVPSRA